MIKINLNFLIAKYAIALSISYIFSSVWVYIFHSFITIGETYSGTEYYLLNNLPMFTSLAINFIMAIMVFIDMKKTNTVNWLIVIVTAMLGFMGVCLFFIQIFYHTLTKKSI